MKPWSEIVIARRRPILIGALLVTVALAIPASSLTIDNSLTQWLPAGDERENQYADFQKTFGSDEFVVVALEGRDWAKPANVETVRALAGRLRKEVSGVVAVHSLADAYDIVKFSPKGAEGFGDFVRSRSPLMRPVLSEDRRMTAIRVIPAAFEEQADRLRFVEEVKRVAAGSKGVTVRVGGPPVINYEINNLSRTEPLRYYPLVGLVIVVLLVFSLRSVAAGLCCLVAPTLAVVWSLAILRLAGGSFNMVLVAVPPLLLLLGVSYSMHVTTRFLGGPGEASAGQRASLAIGAVGRACLLAALTTSAGFLSLLSSSVEPVRQLGLYSALGILFSFVLSMTVLPALLSMVRARRIASAPDGRLVRLGRFAQARGRAILLAGALVAVVAVWGAGRIQAESNIMRFFRERHPMKRDYKYIESRLVGLTPLDVVLSGPAATVYAPAMMGKVRKLQSHLEATGLQDTCAISAVDLVDAGGALGYPTLAGLAGLGFLKSGLKDSLIHVEGDGVSLHVVAYLPTTGTAEYVDMARRTEEYLSEHFSGEGLSARIDGIIPQLAGMQEAIIASQTHSLGIALAVVSLLMLVVLRSFRLALVALMPNLLPIAVTLGVMGWAGILLDTATLTIASVAIGVAVDDTIHFLVAYRAARGSGRSAGEATDHVMKEVGRPMVITTLVASCGFVLLILSQFPPLAYFGLLLSLTLAVALSADLTLLPALLKVTDRRAP